MEQQEQWKVKLLALLEGLQTRDIPQMIERFSVEDYRDYGETYVDATIRAVGRNLKTLEEEIIILAVRLIDDPEGFIGELKATNNGQQWWEDRVRESINDVMRVLAKRELYEMANEVRRAVKPFINIETPDND